MLALVYFWGLSKAGMLSTDEPRYAAIGREMAQSGDWVTPHLWGSPWFEKPPLLYWSTAIATKLSLGTELAPRLPVALAGYAFVAFFYLFVRSRFGEPAALFSTAILGGSAGWLAYSTVAVTDIPLSATFCAALLLALVPGRRVAVATGVLLGLAVLAKGLVPLVLFFPAVWLYRRRIPDLAIVLACCLAVAGPWYALVTLRNGHAFVDEFIWKHHFQRFTSDALQHVRPMWFYLPVLLAGLFPWTPLVVLIRPRLFEDAALKFLGVWTIYALVFFSASRNKLPGYILPLLPALALLIGVALASVRKTRYPLALAALLIGLVPIAASVVPQALVIGLSKSRPPSFDWLWIFAGAFAAGVCLLLEFQDRRADAVILVAVALGITLLRTKSILLPALDRTVSARQFYLRHAPALEKACLQDVNRDQAYGLQYYTGRIIPVCSGENPIPRVVGVGSRLILLD